MGHSFKAVTFDASEDQLSGSGLCGRLRLFTSQAIDAWLCRLRPLPKLKVLRSLGLFLWIIFSKIYVSNAPR